MILALLLACVQAPSPVLVLVTDTTRADLLGAPWPAWATTAAGARVYTRAWSAGPWTSPSTQALLSGEPASSEAPGCWAELVLTDSPSAGTVAMLACTPRRVRSYLRPLLPVPERTALLVQEAMLAVAAGVTPLLVQPLGPHLPLAGHTLPDVAADALADGLGSDGIGIWWRAAYRTAAIDTLDGLAPLVDHAMGQGYVVVWTSDHGESMGEGGRWGHGRFGGGQGQERGLSLDDERISVPLAVMGGGAKPGWDDTPTGTLAVAWTVTGRGGCDLRVGTDGCPEPVSEMHTADGWVRR